MTPTQILDYCTDTDYPPCRACADRAVLAARDEPRAGAPPPGCPNCDLVWARLADLRADIYDIVMAEAERIRHLLPDEKPCAVEALVNVAKRLRQRALAQPPEVDAEVDAWPPSASA